MGYAANGFCFDDAAGAAAYACGHDYPLASTMVDATGHPASVLTQCVGVTGSVLTLQRDVNGVSDGASAETLVSFECDPTDWQQFYPFSMSATTGAEVAAAVLGVWFVGWGWRVVYGVLRGRAEGLVEGDDLGG
jgi:hypothetical protein